MLSNIQSVTITYHFSEEKIWSICGHSFDSLHFEFALDITKIQVRNTHQLFNDYIWLIFWSDNIINKLMRKYYQIYNHYQKLIIFLIKRSYQDIDEF